MICSFCGICVILILILVCKWQVDLEDPKRFRIELTFSRGADLSPLEVNAIQFIVFAVSGIWFESEIQFNSIPLGITIQMVHNWFQASKFPS